VGETSVIMLSPSQTEQRRPPSPRSLISDSSGVTDSICRCRGSHFVESTRIVPLCAHFLTCSYILSSL
jgi:hypothetical protein